MKEHTYHSWTWTGRTAGSSHIIEARMVAEERSDLFVLLICERLWEFRAYGVFIATVCTFLTCRRFICYTSPGRRWLSLLVSRVFPVLGFCFFPGAIFYGKNMNIPNYVLCCHLGVCESCELLHQSPGFICCEGSRVKIGGSPRDHPLQSLDHPTVPHGWPRGNRPMAAWRGPFIGIGGSPFDGPDDIVRSSHGDCRISVRWPADFFHYISGRWPPNRRSMIGRCPTGRRRMKKSGEESADHPANFNCELNLPDHRRMSPGWVPNRQMAAGFLQDSSPGCDPAIDFALLWRSYQRCM